MVMSQYQRCRAGSQPTAWPATFTLAAGDLPGSVKPLVGVTVASGKSVGLSWPSIRADFTTGSAPQVVTDVSSDEGYVLPAGTTTPSSSPSPDVHHGRSR